MGEGSKVYKIGKRSLFDGLVFANLPALALYWLEKIPVEAMILILLIVNFMAVGLWLLLRSFCKIEIEGGKITGPSTGFKRITLHLRKIDHKRTRSKGWGKRIWSIEGQLIFLYPLFRQGQVDRILDTLEKYPFREGAPGGG